ncbi:patatin-like phospholipase family protein [Aminipila luticellarii]|uniref:Patatin n=1 Tax=Aminipila luticellarii TaxID=2507160 RepID=A0A410PYE4_9FIRM|nr:patatin-like phospholipase family protein [Aminipila luticellarii]QAT43915.1 patatin [Aminipila luticellarii]
MEYPYRNLVLSGGGILGIAYIGMLDYLYRIELIKDIKRIAGSSAGAIAACITSFDLPFEEMRAITESLDYSKIPLNSNSTESFYFTKSEKVQLDKIFENAECVYRLVKKYGWYSSGYFYDWIRDQIHAQFDPRKKKPPYTFEDFRNPAIHKNEHEFKELYIVGTDVAANGSIVFSAKDTPYFEVAEAVRISMSVPLFFEAVKTDQPIGDDRKQPRIYADGGIMYRYPITLFDKECPENQTVGALLTGKNQDQDREINNLLDYIRNLISCAEAVQTEFSYSDPENMKRTIQILTGKISSLNFDIKKGDAAYTYLYEQGYKAAEKYFSAVFSS